MNARPQVEHIAAAVTKIAENGGSTALSTTDPPQTVIMGVASHRAGTPDELEARLGGECLELEVAHDHEVDVARALAGSLITIRRTATCCSARGAQPDRVRPGVRVRVRVRGQARRPRRVPAVSDARDLRAQAVAVNSPEPGPVRKVAGR